MAFNVLVVDDSAVMRQMVVRTLRMSGVPLGQVLEAGNGEEGLHVLQEQWVDLLLLDINMPVMNGVQFLETVRAEDRYTGIPVIIVSTAGREADTRKGLSLGAKGYITKPFSPNTLHTMIETIVHLPVPVAAPAGAARSGR